MEKYFTAEDMEKYLSILNEKLKKSDEIGELILYGGSYMCLVLNARLGSKDIDAVFSPVNIIRKFIKEIAEEYFLKDDWLNDAIKGYVVKHEKNKCYLTFSNLRIYEPPIKYILAMKALASRISTEDKNDLKFLINFLDLKKPEEVFHLLEEYYPLKRIEPKTQYFIEEIFEDRD